MREVQVRAATIVTRYRIRTVAIVAAAAVVDTNRQLRLSLSLSRSACGEVKLSEPPVLLPCSARLNDL